MQTSPGVIVDPIALRAAREAERQAAAHLRAAAARYSSEPQLVGDRHVMPAAPVCRPIF